MKLSRKKESAFVVVCFISKRPGSYEIYRPKRAGAWNAKFHSGLNEGVDVHTDDFLRPKVSWMHRLPNFLTHGAQLRAPRARESSGIRITEINITNASLTSFKLEFQHSKNYEVTVFAWNNLGRGKVSTA